MSITKPGEGAAPQVDAPSASAPAAARAAAPVAMILPSAPAATSGEHPAKRVDLFISTLTRSGWIVAGATRRIAYARA